MARPIGSIVQIAPYDWLGSGQPPVAGEYLRSTGGSLYEILDALPTRHTGRYRLVCLKIAPADLPADARVRELWWYPRRKKLLKR